MEVWKTSLSHSEYEISNLGRVRNAKKKILKPHLSNCGYLRIALGFKEKRKNYTVHLLVLEVFSGPRPEGKVCRHLDGIKLNNVETNLKWGTVRENYDDVIKHGSRKGSKNGRANLNEELVIKILKSKLSQKELCKKYSIPQPTLNHLFTRRTWKHVIVN